jgi:hypothetical protein
VEASTSTLHITPPQSPPHSLAPLESTAILSSPPPTVQIKASTEDFDTSRGMSREQIGDYDGAFVDSQEKEFYNCLSSFQEDEEDHSEVKEYGAEDVTSLEDILWPQECLHNVYTYNKSIHQHQKCSPI